MTFCCIDNSELNTYTYKRVRGAWQVEVEREVKEEDSLETLHFG